MIGRWSLTGWVRHVFLVWRACWRAALSCSRPQCEGVYLIMLRFHHLEGGGQWEMGWHGVSTQPHHTALVKGMLTAAKEDLQARLRVAGATVQTYEEARQEGKP